MYRLLLCWRYLRTRYIALASVISVTLGVATMIVVNSVMMGFTQEMQSRIHGILSDVTFESRSLEGFHDPDRHIALIRKAAGQYIEAISPTVMVPGMITFEYGGNSITHPVQIVGVDAATAGLAADLTQYLQHPDNRGQLSFDLHEGGYDVVDHQANGPAQPREQLRIAGWEYRRRHAEYQRRWREEQARQAALAQQAYAEQVEGDPALDPAATDPATTDETAAPAEPTPQNPFATAQPEGAEANIFDPGRETHDGIILGMSIVSFRSSDSRDHFLNVPGDDVSLTFPTVGSPPRAVSLPLTVVDLYESKMSEYDSSLVFVPLRALQESRGMLDPSTGIGNVTALQIKLKRDADGPVVRDLLRRAFPEQVYGIYTWRDKQGPLLQAAQLETRILNVLLFLIIAVAGFGILAIFFMIVVEKTRDVGILKALGASSGGVMGIFLGYGMSLGLVGSGAGAVIGLLFVIYINEIADVFAWLTGSEVFDPSIYYFYKIPAIVDPVTVAWIVAGAVAIAILASVLPARRAARLNPVEALRYE
ncbi:MAG: ABC transporter permease [Pirellulales bacterium]|nr:ABC transporter permease [Pirellulales bacterium]